MAIFDKKQEEPQQVSLSPDQLKELILSIVAEAKKPNEYEQQKMDKARAIEQRGAKEAVELAKAEEERKAMVKRNCPHHNGNTHTWVAQVSAPLGMEPYFVPTCQRCFTQLPPIKATSEQALQGVNLHLYKTLDMAMLENWAVKTHPVAV